MADPLLSRVTLDAFEDSLVRWNVVQGIRDIFDDAGINCDESYEPTTTGTRRKIIAQYYRTVDRSDPRQVRNLLNAFEAILKSLDQIIERADPYDAYSKEQHKTRERLIRRLAADGFEYLGGKIIPMGRAPALTQLQSMAAEFDYPYLLRQLDRIKGSVETDPYLAIGTAKELVETACRTILGNPDHMKGWELPRLYNETRLALQLTPRGVADADQSRRTIEALLTALLTTVQRLSELRNAYGTGHGHDARSIGLLPRHARLAIGAASTLALFLFETHCEQQQPEKGKSGEAGA